MYVSVQSQHENSVPHTAKLPPSIGTRARVRDSACAIICPLGAFLMPPTVCHTVPPTKPE